MRLLYTFFFIAILIFLSIQASYYFDIELPPWVRFYVNDFLCMPIVLTICLSVVHWIKHDKSIRLSLFTILSLTAVYALYFEIYLPKIEPRYTADILDVVMYFSGSMLFYFLQFRD